MCVCFLPVSLNKLYGITGDNPIGRKVAVYYMKLVAVYLIAKSVRVIILITPQETRKDRRGEKQLSLKKNTQLLRMTSEYCVREVMVSDARDT